MIDVQYGPSITSVVLQQHPADPRLNQPLLLQTHWARPDFHKLLTAGTNVASTAAAKAVIDEHC